MKSSLSCFDGINWKRVLYLSTLLCCCRVFLLFRLLFVIHQFCTMFGPWDWLSGGCSLQDSRWLFICTNELVLYTLLKREITNWFSELNNEFCFFVHKGWDEIMMIRIKHIYVTNWGFLYQKAIKIDQLWVLAYGNIFFVIIIIHVKFCTTVKSLLLLLCKSIMIIIGVAFENKIWATE